MVIYGEYLFLENFITGIIITYFTGRIAGEELKRWRIVLCGICCGIYSFVIFTSIAGVLSLAGKIIFAGLITWLAFGKGLLKRMVFNAILFLIVTFLYGGITIALLTAFSWEGITAAEGLYMPHITYLTVTSAAIAGMLIVLLTVSLIKAKRQEERSAVETIVCMGDKQWNLEGFIDSGNFLKEPLTGRPVAVVSKALMEQMLAGIEDARVRYTVIPYNAVGVKTGTLDGYKADYVKIPGKMIKKPVLAVSEDLWPTGGNERQILLPGSMLERGIYAKFD